MNMTMSTENYEKYPGRYVSGVRVWSYSELGITPPVIGVVNYKAGNIFSISKALNLLGANTYEVTSPGDIERADGLILPGVGAFASAMASLRKQQLFSVLKEYAQVQKRMLMGICLGMQLLTNRSTEFGLTDGVAIVPGETTSLDDTGLPLPHVGWNKVIPFGENSMYDGIPGNTHFYFDHSFAVESEERCVSAYSEYGRKFVASFCYDNIWATQFHPEKSQIWGLRLLRNYLDAVVSNRDDAEK